MSTPWHPAAGVRRAAGVGPDRDGRVTAAPFGETLVDDVAARTDSRRPDPGSSPAGLGIGALSRATGIPVETLRTWESRYGFPVPERKPSGHRRYPSSLVPHLRRVAEALARGHRASEVVPASGRDLETLLGVAPVPRPAPSPLPGCGSAELGPLMEAVLAFDERTLERLLHADWARLGLVEFLERRAAPLLTCVGDAWSSGALTVRHEHFLSERLGTFFRGVRGPSATRAEAPLVVLATLPGERHGLGLQMAELVLAAAGVRTLPLGTDLPVDEIASAARDLRARAVGISVSLSASKGATRRALARLRASLSPRVCVLVGGRGAPAGGEGIERVPDFVGLDAWVRELQ